MQQGASLMNEKAPVIIVGAGPAGIAAAIQLQRCGIGFVLFEKHEPGGLLRNAHWVENYPGFPDGISGPDLVGRMITHAHRLGVRITQEKILHIELSVADDRYHVVSDRRNYSATHVIIASGTAPVRLPDEVPAPGSDGRIFYEIADLPDSIRLDKSAKIAIIGAGDAAFDYALNLAEMHSVTIFSRADATRCLPLLERRARNCSSISRSARTVLKRIHPEGTGLKLELLPAGAGAGNRSFSAHFDCLIAAIGRTPVLDFLGRPVSEAPDSKIYFIGDVKNGIVRQTAIAVGDGVHAAMDIARRCAGG